MKRFFAIILAVALMLMTGCESKEERAEKAKTLTRGIWNDNEFVSEFSGLKFTAPDGWQITSDEEIANMIGITADELSARGMEASTKMLELTTIYDMMVQDAATGENIILMYENLAMHVGGTLFSEQAYFELLKQQMDTMDMGYVFSDIGDATLAGETYKSFEGAVSDYGIKQVYYGRKIDNFMLIIITTASLSDTGAIERIMSNFSAT